jgi:oligo-1,6-glucosidase/glucan 1,6-alpha-glucosidase
MINRWLDLGVDGFRLDVIDLIGKDVSKGILSDGPYLNQRLQELKEKCFDGRDIFTVGEMPGLSLKRARDISDEHEGYLNMIFQFGHVGLDEVPGQGKWVLKPLDLAEFKSYFQQAQNLLHEKGWNSLFLANHDQPRAVSRYGNLTYRKESATMLATILYGMQGTPYIYQGEEIGMTGVKFDNINDYQDIETKNMYQEYLAKGWNHDQIMTSIYAKGRDNSRTPMQWNDSINAGFTDGKPWLKVNDNYHAINVKTDLSSQFSVYNYFKHLINIRKSYPVFDDGDFQIIDLPNAMHFSYTRQTETEELLVVGSFSDHPISLDLSLYEYYQPLISNYKSIKPSKETMLPPYYTAIYYHQRKR